MPQRFKPYDNPLDDRRRKVHPDQHDEIRRRYAEGKSQTALAELYGVSRSLIAVIVNPERAATVADRIKRHWQDYSDREDLTKAARKLRKRKREMGLAY
jgi:DNA invertase Pin-like site-specific DNA recombinase